MGWWAWGSRAGVSVGVGVGRGGGLEGLGGGTVGAGASCSACGGMVRVPATGADRGDRFAC